MTRFWGTNYGGFSGNNSTRFNFALDCINQVHFVLLSRVCPLFLYFFASVYTSVTVSVLDVTPFCFFLSPVGHLSLTLFIMHSTLRLDFLSDVRTSSDTSIASQKVSHLVRRFTGSDDSTSISSSSQDSHVKDSASKYSSSPSTSPVASRETGGVKTKRFTTEQASVSDRLKAFQTNNDSAQSSVSPSWKKREGNSFNIDTVCILINCVTSLVSVECLITANASPVSCCICCVCFPFIFNSSKHSNVPQEKRYKTVLP